MRGSERAILIALAALTTAAAGGIILNQTTPPTPPPAHSTTNDTNTARTHLASLDVRGRAPKTGYDRAEYGLGRGWPRTNKHCDTRDTILARDLTNPTYRHPGSCDITAGQLHDPYTATTITLTPEHPKAVEIDHVVALADSWQKGAQQWTPARRTQFATDPDNLQAVDGPTNNQKRDGDAATWLPPNRAYRCTYAIRQITIKHRYQLWVTTAEKDQLTRVLNSCSQP